MPAVRLADHPLKPESVDQPAALIGAEPVRLLGAVGQVEHHHQTQQDRGEALTDEQPLPTGEPPHLIQPKDPA